MKFRFSFTLFLWFTLWINNLYSQQGSAFPPVTQDKIDEALKTYFQDKIKSKTPPSIRQVGPEKIIGVPFNLQKLINQHHEELEAFLKLGPDDFPFKRLKNENFQELTTKKLKAELVDTATFETYDENDDLVVLKEITMKPFRLFLGQYPINKKVEWAYRIEFNDLKKSYYLPFGFLHESTPITNILCTQGFENLKKSLECNTCLPQEAILDTNHISYKHWRSLIDTLISHSPEFKESILNSYSKKWEFELGVQDSPKSAIFSGSFDYQNAIFPKLTYQNVRYYYPKTNAYQYFTETKNAEKPIEFARKNLYEDIAVWEENNEIEEELVYTMRHLDLFLYPEQYNKSEEYYVDGNASFKILFRMAENSLTPEGFHFQRLAPSRGPDMNFSIRLADLEVPFSPQDINTIMSLMSIMNQSN